MKKCPPTYSADRMFIISVYHVVQQIASYWQFPNVVKVSMDEKSGVKFHHVACVFELLFVESVSNYFCSCHS